MSASHLLGAVLAGGESRRFGRDKAAAIVAGKSLVVRAAETLEEVFEHVVIVSSRAATTGRWGHVPDRRPGAGPLAGIEAALMESRALGLQGAFVLACDLPLVDAASVRRVLGAAGDAAACAPDREGSPAIEPLCAVYRLSSLPVVRDALDRGRRSVHETFAAVGGATISLPGALFLNVNAPAEAERATLALGTRTRR